jgi:hypothetical protein
MKRIIACAAVAALAALNLAAQDTPADTAKKIAELKLLLDKSQVVASAGGVMGRTVKSAPYSGLEINENTQMLADGTRIHNETRTTVYRDGEGRVRRENGNSINIWDPVANVTYVLDAKNMTAHKMTMMPAVFMRQGVGAGVGGGAGGGFTTGYAAGTLSAAIAAGGPPANVSIQDRMIVVTRDGKTEKFPVPADGNWTSDDGRIHAVVRQTADAAGGQHTNLSVTEGQLTFTEGQTHAIMMPPGEAGATMVRMPVRVGDGPVTAVMDEIKRERMAPANMEQLGEQNMEGVKSRGTRTTNTIQAGEIGNDRPLTTVSERWYSDELQTEILNKRTDPRMGENTFRLTNINRGEPAAYLFQIPSGYNVIERK